MSTVVLTNRPWGFCTERASIFHSLPPILSYILDYKLFLFLLEIQIGKKMCIDIQMHMGLEKEETIQT